MTRRFLRTIAILTVLAVAAGPVVVSLAGAAPDAGTTVVGHADHAQHGGAAGLGGEGSSCPKHQGCQGFCCSACAHCAAATPNDPARTEAGTSADHATIPALHGLLVPSRINRPPQAA